MPTKRKGFDAKLARAISVALHKQRRRRDLVLTELSRVGGYPMKSAQLYKFSDSKSKQKLPAAYLPALTVATRDARPLRILVEEAGYHLSNPKERLLVKLGRACLAQKRSTEQIEKLQRESRRKKAAQ